MEDFITASWNGHTSLYRVFWVYHIIGVFFLILFFHLTKWIFGFIGVMFAIVVILGYSVWILVSLWQCSYNCVEPKWTWATRIYVYVMPVTLVFGLVALA